MRRCRLSHEGKVLLYYGDPNFSEGHTLTMVEIPKFWYKKEVKNVNGERVFTFAISDKPEQGFKVHPAFFRDRDGDGIAEEVDHRYYGAFEGTVWSRSANVDDDVLGSCGFTHTDYYKPETSRTLAAFRKLAENNGPGWGIVDFNLLSAVQMLYLTEYGHFDTQSKIGKGITSDKEKHHTGETIHLGNATGEAPGEVGKRAMSYRGIENWYGNVHERLDGCIYDESVAKIGNVNFNDKGNGYKSKSSVNTSVSGGSITNIIDHSDLFFIPNSMSGSSYNSHLYAYGKVVEGSAPIFGGSYGNSYGAGGFHLSCSPPTSVSPNMGARLAY